MGIEKFIHSAIDGYPPRLMWFDFKGFWRIFESAGHPPLEGVGIGWHLEMWMETSNIQHRTLNIEGRARAKGSGSFWVFTSILNLMKNLR